MKVTKYETTHYKCPLCKEETNEKTQFCRKCGEEIGDDNWLKVTEESVMSIEVGYPTYIKICSKCNAKPARESDVFCGICGGKIVDGDMEKPSSGTGC